GWDVVPLCLLSFPTRRSSDLWLGSPLRRVSARGPADRRASTLRCRDPFPCRLGCPSLLFHSPAAAPLSLPLKSGGVLIAASDWRSEEHTSELQSRENLVCRLL